jgi:hypothetical protein
MRVLNEGAAAYYHCSVKGPFLVNSLKLGGRRLSDVWAMELMTPLDKPIRTFHAV